MTTPAINRSVFTVCRPVRWRLLRAPLRQVVVAMALMIATSIHVGASVGQTSDARIDNVVAPRTFDQLLRNFKTAIDAGLLVKREFYVDETLTRFFGQGQFYRRENNDARISGDLLSKILDEPVPGAPNQSHDVSVEYIRSSEAGSSIEALVKIVFRTISVQRPTFSTVETLFGGGWTVYFDPRPGPMGRPRATAPHGNELIIYNPYAGKPGVELRVEFSHDARIQEATVIVTQ